MKSISVVTIVLLALVLGIANGFVVSPRSALNVRQSQRQKQTGGIQMFFGGGGKKAAKGGIVVTVQQKTGFKETEITLPGKTNLRKALLDNKVDVYPLQVSICSYFFLEIVGVESWRSHTHTNASNCGSCVLVGANELHAYRLMFPTPRRSQA